MTEHTYTEAPASATVKVKSPAGFEWLLTSRADTTAELLQRLPVVEKWLADNGWEPAGGNRATAPTANGSAPLCPTHGQPMKASTHGGYFCPVKVAESGGGADGSRPIYCKAKVG